DLGVRVAAAAHAGAAHARPHRAAAGRVAGADCRLPRAGAAVRARDRLPGAGHGVRSADPVGARARRVARPPAGAAVRRRTALALAIAAANVGLGLALEHGALRALPPALRSVLAFVVLLAVPGAGWARAIGARPACGRALMAGGALACGVAWLGLLVLVTRVLGLPFTALAHGGAA